MAVVPGVLGVAIAQSESDGLGGRGSVAVGVWLGVPSIHHQRLTSPTVSLLISKPEQQDTPPKARCQQEEVLSNTTEWI